MLDLGANDGTYSRLAAEHARYVVACEFDEGVVDRFYRQLRAEGERRILPLVMDLANPSPGIGWRGRERASLEQRGPADAALALAVIHHLAIGRNVPLPDVVDWLAALGRRVVVEFVDPADPMAQRLLANKPAGLFGDYRRDVFERMLRRSGSPSSGGRSCRRAPACCTRESRVTEQRPAEASQAAPAADGQDAAPAADVQDAAPAAVAPAAAATVSGAGRSRAELYAFLEITALCGLALAQPLLDVIGKSPDFFLFYGAGRVDIVLLLAVLVLVPPVVLWGVGALAGRAVGAWRRPAGAWCVGRCTWPPWVAVRRCSPSRSASTSPRYAGAAR